MGNFIKRLRGLGGFFGLLANVLAFLTTNWGLVVTVVVAVGASVWDQAFALAKNPHVQVAVGVFLALLWTYVALRVLGSLNAISTVKMQPDFRHAISPESFGLALDEDDPEAALQLILNFRNVLNWPIKIRIDRVTLIIGDRTCPEPDKPIEMVIPRIAVRGIRSGTFKKDVIKRRNSGSIEMVISYGDVDGAYERRYRLKSKLHFNFKQDDDGKITNAGVSEEFVSTEDEAI
jgi:hypothetical protein